MRVQEFTKEEYDCPVCGKRHVVVRKRHTVSEYVKNTKVVYGKQAYYCEGENTEFIPDQLADKNAMELRECYRRKAGLLTASEIREIRDMYGVTQKEYSRLLGVGEATIQRYETKAIQDATYDMVMRATREYPHHCLEMLEKNRSSFDEKRYREIRNGIITKLKEAGANCFMGTIIRTRYAEYDVPEERNGYCCLDIVKIKNILIYLAEKIGYLYKPKAMKLLWYIDELSFKHCGKAMTGLVYVRRSFGILPVAHHEILCLEGLKVTEKEHDDYTAYRIEAARTLEAGVFAKEEQAVILRVLHKFCTFSTKELAQYMREETAYRETEENTRIPFCKALEIRDF